MGLAISEYIELNGANQFLSIRAEKTGLPLLLYLHGGPGDAALPLMLKYCSELERFFTVIVWEQRGAGKSYYKFAHEDALTIQTFVDDTRTLVELMLERFGQQKLYLVGHSWGSVLGLQSVIQFPELIAAYIGCGQVVNMKKSSRLALEYALTQNERTKNRKAVERLQKIDCSYAGDGWLDDLLYVTGQVVKHNGSLYGKSSYNDFVFEFIRSSSYTLKDLINRQRGGLQSIKFLWQELMTVDFESVTAFSTPVTFIEGKYDSHVSSVVAHNYYDTIKTEKSFHLFEKSCHFPHWSEAERFCSVMSGMVCE